MSGYSGGGGGGDLVKIQSQTAVGAASIQFTSGIGAAYGEYIVKYSLVPANDTVVLWGRSSTDGGSSFDAGASDYRSSGVKLESNGSLTAYKDDAAAEIALSVSIGNDAGNSVGGEVRIVDPSDASLKTQFVYHNNGMNNSAPPRTGLVVGAATRDAAEDVDAFELKFAAGNLTGWATLYGVKK